MLLQISIVKKGEAREPRETRKLFRELALLQVPWEALGTGSYSQLSPEREFSMEESTYEEISLGMTDCIVVLLLSSFQLVRVSETMKG
jgi:hypothetical protein